MAAIAGKADLMLHEGVVVGHPESDSVAISGGQILALGNFADLKSMVGPRTHLIKLAGRAVAPGFIDSHLHFLEAAAAATGLSVQRCRSVGDLLADLRVAAGKTPPGNWLRAFGCDEALMYERRGPTRAELDQALPKNPLRLRHQTLHATWLNSRAINLLGLEAPNFAPPEGAQLFRDGAGKLTGLVVGMETWVTQHLPLVTRSELESRARVMSRELSAAGVTTFTDATTRNGSAEFELFAKLVQANAITQRVGVMAGAQHLDSIDHCAKVAHAAGIALAGVKFMPGYPYDRAGLSRPVRLALTRGLDCAFHVTEVEELEETLAALELARPQIPGDRAMPNLRIEHGGMIPPDYVDRLAALDAWVVTNPGFIHFRGPKYAEEPGLIPYLYRARSLKDAGIKLAGATDAPVTPARPFAAIAAAISRTTVDGAEMGVAEALAPIDAFALFTTEAARLAGLDTGAIEPDYLADLIVLPRDPLALPPADLMNISVDITIVAGKVVYERGRPAVASSDSADLHSG
ncbi:MAG: amidohydrolase family protein [Candidatus Binatus sp.]|uniref:amidohydrolase n=1 Tax=Candidatus Binatus sp. TaxID=2811406 RepID=UPI00272174DD|nr:amidohydrolase family protein [Candidatus Binatus sp.]MDO8433031.1 amidohydrolase family protein [Candidatus Binatus sp.]